MRLDYSYASLFHKLMCTKYSQLSAFENDSPALFLDDPGSYGPAKLPIHHKKRYFGTFSIRNQYYQRDLKFDMIFCIIITHYHLIINKNMCSSFYLSFFCLGWGVVSASLSSHFHGFVRPSGPSLAQTLAVAFPTYPHRGGSCWKKGHQTQVGEKVGKIFGMRI